MKNEHDIETPEDLDTALAGNALLKHATLWKVAEGRTMRWPEIVGLVAAGLWLVSAVAGLFRENWLVVQVALAILLIDGFLVVRTQMQISALCELVRKLERSGTRYTAQPHDDGRRSAAT
jgi:hypothetical protein